MKLAKLLAAGQSFFGGKGVVAYRENKHVYLPKFGSEKNPFAPKLKEAVAPVDVKQVSAPVAAAPVVAKTQSIFTPPPSRPVAAKPARAGWADKLNPFRAPQPAVESPVTAVQPEFSLDAVKVLHNDLSDADVEVVPVKSRPAKSMAAKPSGPADYLGEPVLRTI